MSQQLMEETLHETYLPFTEGQLREHFIEKRVGDETNLGRHTDYFKNSIGRCRHFDGINPVASGDVRTVRQIEKDERFWTVAAFMTLYHSDTRDNAGENRANLEGATNVDTLLINASNGFAVLIEAKLLSDISCQVSYDIKRNQIARTLDVMLHSDDKMTYPLNERRPENSLFMLVTPQAFKDNPYARFYGYKFLEYATDTRALAGDLPHRGKGDVEGLGRRMGWTSWEGLKGINGDCCGWL